MDKYNELKEGYFTDTEMSFLLSGYYYKLLLKKGQSPIFQNLYTNKVFRFDQSTVVFRFTGTLRGFNFIDKKKELKLVNSLKEKNIIIERIGFVHFIINSNLLFSIAHLEDFYNNLNISERSHEEFQTLVY